jgi:signal transduction histidine kinase/CheY-like chemotaxis protein
MNRHMRTGSGTTAPLPTRHAVTLGVAFFVTHALSLLLVRYGGPLAPAWPPAGIGLAALLLLPSHRLHVFVAYALLDTLSNALQGYATPAGFGYLAVGLFELWLAEWMLRRVAPGRSWRFAQVREVLTIVPVCAAAAALASVGAALVADLTTGAALGVTMTVWWVADMLAYIIVTPLVVLAMDPPRDVFAGRTVRHLILEAVAVVVVLLVMAPSGFLQHAIAGGISAHPYMLTLPLLWATLRFGQIGALGGILVIAAVGVSIVVFDRFAAFNVYGSMDVLTALQLFLGILGGTSLVLATALREQQETAAANARMVDALTASEHRLRQSQKMEAIGQLAGGVAHDFNNVLAAVLMQLDELRHVRSLPRAAHALTADVEQSVQRAARLTRQLLVFSRQQAMQRQLLDLNQLVQSHLRLLRRVVLSTHSIAVSTHQHPLVVNVDGGMIEQVLLNLVLNARDAQVGGGPIVVATSVRELANAQDDLAAGRYALLSVRDTGVGIAPELLPRVFEPFFTTKPPGQGTGLGLATAYGIVQQHGGVVRVASELGHGTTVEVWLPIEAVELPASDRPVDLLDHDSGEHRVAGQILLVEDEASVRRLLERVLTRAGYVVHTATDGHDALAQWDQLGESLDLLITDLVMPGGLSGSQLARDIRLRRPDLPIVFTSGYDPEFDPAAVTMIPGDNFIPKPATADQILAVVRRQLAVAATRS